MAKNQAGKERKARTPAQQSKAEQPPSTDPQKQVAGAHLDKPGAVAHPDAGQSSGVTQSQAKAGEKLKPGAVAIVSKGAERIPVQLKDEAHLAKLVADHGKANVEVQS